MRASTTPSPAAVRALLGRRSFAELKAALSAAPARVGALWPKLNALERAACWRLLPPSALAAASESMSQAARWEAYQASSVDCLAPYLEDAHIGDRKYFRAPTRREAALLALTIAYNALAVTMAVLGVWGPFICAIGMPLSSLAAIAVATWWRPFGGENQRKPAP